MSSAPARYKVFWRGFPAEGEVNKPEWAVQNLDTGALVVAHEIRLNRAVGRTEMTPGDHPRAYLVFERASLDVVMVMSLPPKTVAVLNG